MRWRDVEESLEVRLPGPDLTVPLRKVGGRKMKKPQDLILDLGGDARLLERVRAESRPRRAVEGVGLAPGGGGGSDMRRY